MTGYQYFEKSLEYIKNENKAKNTKVETKGIAQPKEKVTHKAVKNKKTAAKAKK